MKKTGLFILFAVASAILVFTAISSHAEVTSGEFGEGLTWSFDGGTGTLTVSGDGAIPDYEIFLDAGLDIPVNHTTAPWGTLYSDVKKVVVAEGITSVGKAAFSNLYGATEISIPDSVTYIGDRAFNECTSLECITVPDGVAALNDGLFTGCVKLTEVVVPDGLTAIGNGVFDGCSLLTPLVLPEGVISIGDKAFMGCEALTGITVPASTVEIGDSAFAGCSSLTAIDVDADNVSFLSLDGALYDCAMTELKGYPAGKTDEVFTVPSSVIRISPFVFENCGNLREVLLPDGLEAIPTGTSGTALSPRNTATRAQIATIVMKYDEVRGSISHTGNE